MTCVWSLNRPLNTLCEKLIQTLNDRSENNKNRSQAKKKKQNKSLDMHVHCTIVHVLHFVCNQLANTTS